MPDRKLKDEDIERILKEYHASKSEINNNEENIKQKKKKRLSGEDRFEKWVDNILLWFDGPLKLLFKFYNWNNQKIYTPFWKKMIRYVSSHRICPHIVDYLYAVMHYVSYAVFTFPIVFLLGLLFFSYEIKDIFVVSFCLNFGFYAFYLILLFLYNPTIILYLFDFFTKKQKISLLVELKSIRIQDTNLNYWDDVPLNFLAYLFSGSPVACYFLYIPLKEDHIPMSSKSKKPPDFYQRFDSYSYRGNKTRIIRFIMTKKKSKQIDKLFELVPSAEFEISYLRFSHILKEIHPIEGYEYPEGTKEICEKINKMYP